MGIEGFGEVASSGGGRGSGFGAEFGLGRGGRK
jgi:hypothetical protein